MAKSTSGKKQKAEDTEAQALKPQDAKKPAPVAKAAGSAKAGKGKSTTASAKPAAGAGGTPMVDTNLAAQSAARMLAARAAGGGGGGAPAAAGGGGDKRETSTFKQMKESLAKPHAASMNTLLNSTTAPGAKKGNLPLHGGKQVGHNQTFGSDASRNFVPRRTGG